MSGYKTIVAHLTDPVRAQRLMRVAFGVASCSKAHLVDLYTIPPSFIIGAGMPGTPSPIVFDGLRRQFQQTAAEIHSIFDDACAGASRVGEWRFVDAEDSSAPEVVLPHSRSTDLVIASQVDPAWVHAEV